jgi:hypothetical protein
MIACNDYILLECALYRVLRMHFAGHAAYAQLLDLFHEVWDGREGGVRGEEGGRGGGVIAVCGGEHGAA